MRGRPEVKGKIDWFFDLEGEGEDAIIHVKGRRRGEPLDLVVAEAMIFANSVWGEKSTARPASTAAREWAASA